MATTKRPWGFWEVLKEEPNRKIKLLTVKPGHQLSMQRHFEREEDWFVIEGSGYVTLHSVKFYLDQGDSINVPAEAWHQLVNNGEQDLVIVEIQTGERCSEDDIERRDDVQAEELGEEQ